MFSISKIVNQIKKKTTIPDKKYLDIVISNLGSAKISSDYFIEEDQELVDYIGENHIALISNKARLSDAPYYLKNPDDYSKVYRHIVVYDPQVPFNITVSYRIADTLDDTDEILSSIE